MTSPEKTAKVAAHAGGGVMSKLLIAVVVVALGVAIVWRFTQKAQARELAEPSTEAPSVRVGTPSWAPKTVTLSLPGSVRPREHVVLYARTNGFLREWLVDLGDTVKKGQTLARIDTPEIGANLTQARARLQQAKASIVLVKGQHERVVNLEKTGSLSAQDIDTSALRLAAAESELLTATAEVERLSALVGFATLTAPFDGTVTRRYLDNGALVSTGTTAMFEVASTGDLRVDVDVPQWVASQVTPGTQAQVTIGKDGKAYDAQVSRIAGTLDPTLRTMGVQLVFKASPGTLVPGSYARVKFEVPRAEPVLQVPNAALVVRGGGQAVGVVSDDGALHYRPVRVLRDIGRDVEVEGELQPGVKIALYPSPSLVEGQKVTPVEGGEKK